MFRRLVAATGGLLVLFHLWLFGSQLLAGRLTEPGPALRWIAAAGLVVALVALRRSGTSIFRGRQAVAIWLLAGLLHGPAVAGSSTYESPALAEVVTSLVQIAAAAIVIGFGLAVLAGAVRRLVAPRLVRARAIGRRRRQPHGPASCLRSAPRPPPYVASLVSL